MRSTKVLVLLLTLGALPLGAQLTPAQRQEREARDLSLNYNRYLAQHLEERALAGDASAYGGPAGWEGRNYWMYGARWGRLVTRMGAPYPFRTHWGALDKSARHSYALDRITDTPFKGEANKPMVLTLASPVGAPGMALKIRTVLEGDEEGSGWNRTGEVTADAEGRYIIEIPPFAAGKYELQIEIYSPKAPDVPYSSSLNTVKVE